MRVLAYGATGAQGEPVARQLLQRGHEVNVVVRHPEKASHLEQMGAKVYQGDLNDPSSLESAHEGADAVFLMLPFSGGGNPVAQAGAALEAAKRAGVTRLVLNTSGQTPSQPTGLPMMDYRIALEAMVRDSGLQSVILRPTAYMENFMGPWTLPGIQHQREVAYPVSKDRPTSWIAAEDLGQFAVAALERPELSGQAFDLGGPEALTGDQIAQSFSRALGHAFTYRAISPDEFGDLMAQLMGPEAGEATRTAYRAGEAAPLDAMKVDIGAVLEKLPINPTTLEDWVRARRDVFLAEVPA
jgi:uncharacterized protein YbjT (DUF2867 family)